MPSVCVVMLLGACALFQGCWRVAVPPNTSPTGRVVACAMYDELLDRALERGDVTEADESLQYLRENCLAERYDLALLRYQAHFQRLREEDAQRRCQPTVDRITVSWRHHTFQLQAQDVRGLCHPRDVEQQIAQRGHDVEASCQVELDVIRAGDKRRCGSHQQRCAQEDFHAHCGVR